MAVTQRGRGGLQSVALAKLTEELLFQANPQPMWVYDVETLAFLAANDAACKKYGYTRDEFLRMTIKDIRPPEDLSRLTEDVTRRAPSTDTTDAWRHLRKDGSPIDVQILWQEFDLDGRRSKLVAVTDVTQLKQTEEELRRSDARTKAIVASALDAIITMDHEGTIVAFNPAAERLFGWPATIAVGRPVRDLIPLD